jgi:hypothetical protein
MCGLRMFQTRGKGGRYQSRFVLLVGSLRVFLQVCPPVVCHYSRLGSADADATLYLY